MNYQGLKQAVMAVIRANGRNLITGDLLQNVLLSMISSLGQGYQFMGIAEPDDTPAVTDERVYYLAVTAGTYTNFGGLVVTGDSVVILIYDTEWQALDTGMASGEFIQALADSKATWTQVQAALAEKLSGRGENPALVAGSARTVLGAAIGPVSPMYRKTVGGTGAVRIKELRGNTTESGGILYGNDCVQILSRGINQWDEEWEPGIIDLTVGEPISGNGLRAKNFIPAIPGGRYFLNIGNVGPSCHIFFYDGDNTYIEEIDPDGADFEVPANAHYMKFDIPTTAAVMTYNHNVCLNLSDSAINGQYFPYFQDLLALSPSGWTSGGVAITPIGLNGHNGVYDKAIVDPDGVIRRVTLALGMRAYQEGDENDPAVVTDTYSTTVYILATPVTYTLDVPIAATYAAVEGGSEFFSPNYDADFFFPSITMISEPPAIFDRDFISASTLENFMMALEGELGGTFTMTWNATTREWEFNIS